MNSERERPLATVRFFICSLLFLLSFTSLNNFILLDGLSQFISSSFAFGVPLRAWKKARVAEDQEYTILVMDLVSWMVPRRAIIAFFATSCRDGCCRYICVACRSHSRCQRKVGPEMNQVTRRDSRVDGDALKATPKSKAHINDQAPAVLRSTIAMKPTTRVMIFRRPLKVDILPTRNT